MEKSADKGASGTHARRALCDPTVLVVASVLLGVGLGLLFSHLGWDVEEVVQVLGFPGQLWLKALKCIVLPMIVFSMIQSMVMLKSLPGARTIGIAVVGLYSFTTLCAAMVGCMVCVLVLQPLIGDVSHLNTDGQIVPDLAKFTALESILNIFDGLVPSNLISDAADNRLLPVIVASIIFGLLVKDKNEDGTLSTTLVVVKEMNDVVVKVVTVVMTLTPLGAGSLVFAAVAKMDFAQTGLVVIKFVLSVAIGLGLHFFVVYPTLVTCLARRNPFSYVFGIIPALLTAFGTSSSAAALPVTQQCSIENNKISPHIAKFVLSLGATINMDGTGLYLICAAFFIGTIEGVTFGLGKFATMAVLAMLCSLGTAPVPSASLVLLSTIMTSVGIPLTSTFGLVWAVDWLLDRMRTVVNVAGDASVTAVVDRFYGQEENDDECSDASVACRVETV
jgi:Na+/H+-dicarboxylate symporter